MYIYIYICIYIYPLKTAARTNLIGKTCLFTRNYYKSPSSSVQIIYILGLASERNSVVVGSNPTQTSFL